MRPERVTARAFLFANTTVQETKKGGLDSRPFLTTRSNQRELLLVVRVAIREDERQHLGAFGSHRIQACGFEPEKFQDGWGYLSSFDEGMNGLGVEVGV